MTVKFTDERSTLYQGDSERFLVLTDYAPATRVSFEDSKSSSTMDVDIAEDGVAAIPNQLLNGDYDGVINYYIGTDTYTIWEGVINIKHRQLPSNYMLEPTRVTTWEEIKAEMESLRDESATSAEMAQSAAESATDAETAVATMESSVKTSESNVQTMEKAIETAKLAVDTNASAVESARAEVEANSEKVSIAESNVQSMKASVSISESNVKAAEENVASMKSAVSIMQSSVSASQSAVSSAEGRISQAEERIKEMEDSAESSKNAVANSEANVTAMEKTVESARAQVESNTSQVSADKAEVTTMKESVQGAVDALSGFGATKKEFPKSDDKILILDGTEGKYITAGNLVDYVKTHDINPTYAELKALVNSGNFFDTYECGQAINVDFTYGGTTYAFPFQVAHDTYRETTRPDGTTRQSVPLLATYLPPMSVQFSQYRAFLACPSGLAAGSYSVTFAQAWSKLTTLTWYFTLTHAVPAGGRLNAFRNWADGQSDTSVRTYGADGKLMYTDTTVTSTAIDGATSLGTMNYTTRNGNFSSMQECFYGCNEYHTSAKKQFMDSDKPVNLWWAPQDEWDCAPDALSSYGGLLSYFDPDFVDILETVKVTTAKSTALGAASADCDTDYLRCFLPSLEEMYIAPQASTGMEGAYLQLAKDYVGKDSPNGWYSSNANTGLIRYDITNKSANWFHLRSALRSYSCYVWGVNDGYVYSYYYASYARRVLPLVYI